MKSRCRSTLQTVLLLAAIAAPWYTCSVRAQMADVRISPLDSVGGPGIVAIDSGVIVTWQDQRRPASSGGRFILTPWITGTPVTDSALVPLYIPPLEYYEDGFHHLESYSHEDYVVQHDGACVANSIRHLQALEYTPGGTSFSETRSFGAKYIVTRSGWTKWFEEYVHGHLYVVIRDVQTSEGYDRDRRELVTFFARHGLLNMNIYEYSMVTACDTNGKTAWKIENIFPPVDHTPTLIPIGRKEFLLIYDRRAVHYRDTVRVGTFELPAASVNARYQRLHGDRFLRVSADAARSFAFEIYDFEGRLLARRNLQFPTTVLGYAITERADSSLIVVWSGDSGVRALMLHGGTLGVGARDWRISDYRGRAESPVCVPRGDSLYVVWVDRRSGRSNVFGAVHPIPRVTSWEENGELKVEREIQDTEQSTGCLDLR